MPTPILLHLSGGFALGDSIQFTIALKHLRKYRQDWVLDCCCPEEYAFILAPFCTGFSAATRRTVPTPRSFN